LTRERGQLRIVFGCFGEEDGMRINVRDTYDSAASSWSPVPDLVFGYVWEELYALRKVLKQRPRYTCVDSVRVRFEKTGTNEATVHYEVLVKVPTGTFEYKEAFVIDEMNLPAYGILCAEIVKTLDDGVTRNRDETYAELDGFLKN
jgi:hypothetical protein